MRMNTLQSFRKHLYCSFISQCQWSQVQTTFILLTLHLSTTIMFKFIASSLQQHHNSQFILWSPGPTQFPQDPLCTFRNQHNPLLQNRILGPGAPSHFRGSSDPETGPCCTRSQLFGPSSLVKGGFLFLCSFTTSSSNRFPTAPSCFCKTQ